jgi:excisionase family DNA binding protein
MKTIESRTENLITISELAKCTKVSQRTLFRLLKDEKFPRIKVNKRLLFDKDAALKYIINTYGNFKV